MFGQKGKAHIPLKLRLCRLPNANEINTKNMKCTCPTQRPNARDPTHPIFHWLALGFCVGGNANFTFLRRGQTQILCFVSGETRILAFSDTNMLVSPAQNSGVGGLSQRQGPTQLFCVAVEYRLKCFGRKHWTLVVKHWTCPAVQWL